MNDVLVIIFELLIFLLMESKWKVFCWPGFTGVQTPPSYLFSSCYWNVKESKEQNNCKG